MATRKKTSGKPAAKGAGAHRIARPERPADGRRPGQWPGADTARMDEHLPERTGGATTPPGSMGVD